MHKHGSHTPGHIKNLHKHVCVCEPHALARRERGVVFTLPFHVVGFTVTYVFVGSLAHALTLTLSIHLLI